MLALLEELQPGKLKFYSIQSRLSFLDANEVQKLIMKAENKGYVVARPIYSSWDRKEHKVQVEYEITKAGLLHLRKIQGDTP